MRDGRLIAVLLFVGLVACGGGGKKTVDEPTGDDVATGDDDDGGGGGGGDVMVPPEKMEEINVRLDRKRPTVARCLSDAVLSGDAPKNARGKITLEFVISAAGRAENINVTKASFENEKVTSCVISKVQDIAFPELPKSLEWSYTFAFESIN
jgi:hypothetical protein